MENRPFVEDKEFYLNSRKLYTDKHGHHGRRVDFRKYLETTGVLNRVTGILMDLYENPVVNIPVSEYVRMKLLDTNPDDVEYAKLRPKLDEANLIRKRLKKENKRLRETFKKYNYAVVSSLDEKDDNKDRR